MCEACKNKGWLHATDDGKHEIQRCDSCEIVGDDDAATKLHDVMCGCGWTLVPEHTEPFNVSERAKRLAEIIGRAIDEELSHPTTGWVAPYVRTAVCDGIAHEYRRIMGLVKDCKSCSDKITPLQDEALKQRFIG